MRSHGRNISAKSIFPVLFCEELKLILYLQFRCSDVESFHLYSQPSWTEIWFSAMSYIPHYFISYANWNTNPHKKNIWDSMIWELYF